MVTVVNSPGPGSVERADSGAGWAVAVIILLVVLAVGAFAWMRYNGAPAAPARDGGANINVTLPDVTPDGGAGGGAGGGGGTGGTGGGGGAAPTPAPTQ